MNFVIILMAALLFFAPAMAEETLIEVILFEGQMSVSGAWQLITGVNTTNAYGEFDPYLIREGGCFIVEYTGTPGAIYLAMSEWQSGTWSQVDAPAFCESVDNIQKATFTFEQCVQKYGSADFSDVDQVCVGSADSTVDTEVLRIIWQGKPVQDELGADSVLFRGAVTSYTANTNMAFVFTKHVGGEFDAAQIGPGARIYAEYTGQKNGVYLALSSHSGATQWARVNASEIVDCGNDVYGSYFDYGTMLKAWGDNFARLDQVSVFSDTPQEVTLRKLTYFAGDGAPTDTSAGKWDRPDTGIAFIGDSICQNAQLLFGDWNTILGRTDCCNYGIGGQTTQELVARIGELVHREYSMVVFICGINDIGHGHSNEKIIKNYDEMIKAIQEKNPDCQFLLVSVLPTTDAFYVGQQDKICQLNSAYEEYAVQTDGVTYVDTYSAFTAKAGEYAYPEFLSDGLHPNQEGYAKIAEILVPYLP